MSPVGVHLTVEYEINWRHIYNSDLLTCTCSTPAHAIRGCSAGQAIKFIDFVGVCMREGASKKCIRTISMLLSWFHVCVQIVCLSLSNPTG